MKMISQMKLFTAIIIFLIATSLRAQSNKLPFDEHDIVEQVRHNPDFPGVRDDEFLIDTSVVYVSADGAQSFPVVAFDGINYLVVWQDTRSFPHLDIYCARVNQAGVVLDSAGIAIAKVTYDLLQSYANGIPAVAYNGTDYFVVWQDRRYGSTYDLYGARISTSGVVLDTNSIAISTAIASQKNPSIVSGNTDYLVVWEDERDGMLDIYGARVSSGGVVLDPDGIAICAAADSQRVPSVAFGVTNYFIVWQNRDSMDYDWDIRGARVDTNGVVLDPNSIAISATDSLQGYPSIAFDGTNYLVVWEDERNALVSPDVYGTRVSQTGVVFEPDGIAISTIPISPEWNPSVAFDGTNYLVVWGDDRNGTMPDIYGARVSQDGDVLDTLGFSISVTGDEKSLPTVAFGDTNYLVVWRDERVGPPGDIYGARVSPAGAVLDPAGINVSTAAVFLDDPAVAYDGTNFLVAWEDYRQGLYRSDIYGARVTPNGSILDSPGFVICNASFGQYSPSIACDGTNYCVVWTHNIGGSWAVYGTRVSPDGIILDPSLINISCGNMALSPQVASSSTDNLVVWVDYRDSYTMPDIYGARVDPSGIVLDPSGIAISTLDDLEYLPSVAFGSTNYLVVWEDSRNGLYDIYCARVDPNGVVIDPNGIAIIIADSLQRHPSAAFDGTNYLVVWEDGRNGTCDIYGARVNISGVVLDTNGIIISNAVSDQKGPSVAFDGTDYVVTWEDSRNGHSSDIYGALVSANGAVVDSFALSTQLGYQQFPAIAHGVGSQMLVTYSGWTEVINTHPVNAMRIWGKFYPSVGIEENALRPTLDVPHLLQVYPNPFRDRVNIELVMNDGRNPLDDISLRIYDVSGRLIKNLLLPSAYFPVPTAVFWEGTGNSGKKLPSGVYFLKLEVGDYSATEKLLLIR